MSEFKNLEIQNDNIIEIATYSAIDAKRKVKGPIFVEDSGLFIKSLRGFPGPYSSYVFKTIGCTSILNLLKDYHNREAEFRSVIAYTDNEMKNNVKIFVGSVLGKITTKTIGGKGFGFDPIFIPNNQEKTFSEMELREKNKFSHRGKSLREFALWFNSNILT
jgi:XTP/dITP diphosphohydrolase